jgi:hypothetical protein
MSRLWPVRESAQADYESLRASVLHGDAPEQELLAMRFRRLGLAGLVLNPVSEPIWRATMSGARRPPWSPGADPRLEVLAAAYELLLSHQLVGSAFKCGERA